MDADSLAWFYEVFSYINLFLALCFVAIGARICIPVWRSTFDKETEQRVRTHSIFSLNFALLSGLQSTTILRGITVVVWFLASLIGTVSMIAYWFRRWRARK